MSERKDIAMDSGAAHINALREEVDLYLSDLAEEKSPRSLYEPVADVLVARGKRLRPLLTLLTAEGFGVGPSVAIPGAAAVEVFHNFTLVHDDIMDRSATRRGKPTVHVRWGVSAGILAGDFLLGLAYKLIARLPENVISPALATFSHMVVRLCEGQALDAEFESSNDVSVEDYLDMISRKTGALLVASLQLGGIIGEASALQIDTLGRVGHHLGLAFQIQDDLLDLTADPKDWGKPIGTDLVAGKRAFLLLRAVDLERERGGDWFRSIMEQRGIEQARIDEVKSRMEQLGVLESAKGTILSEYAKAQEALESLERDVSLEGVRRIIDRMRTRVR